MPNQLDYLIAALELAEEAERDENGFLTESSRQAVMNAYGSVDKAELPEQEAQKDSHPKMGDSPFKKRSDAV